VRVSLDENPKSGMTWLEPTAPAIHSSGAVSFALLLDRIDLISIYLLMLLDWLSQIVYSP
jgi:hypothetical protein